MTTIRNEARYTIGELADIADTTPRTIRYYTAEGLLPPPDTRGRYALYSAEHLSRLQAITRLKEAYLPLHEIKARLDLMTVAEIQQLLDEPAIMPSSSAADYVAQVMAGQPQAQPARVGETMLRYAPRAQAEPPAAPSPAPVSPVQRSDADDLARKRNTMLARAPDETDGAQHWRRIVLGAGVELHVQEPVPPEIAARLPRFLAQARAFFELSDRSASEGGST